MSDLKMQAGNAALAHVEPGMRLGIGTGSTAEAFIQALGERVAEGFEIIGVATSQRTQELCLRLGMKMSTLDETPQLDLTIDGADEIDPSLNLIKGGGGALLREKIVAAASARMVVIADETKLVDALGAFPLPIEINPFGHRATLMTLEKLAKNLAIPPRFALRQRDDGATFETDGGHWIIDASFGRNFDPEGLESALNMVPGVVENGLFTGMADMAIIAGRNGIREINRT